jgi:hypothetical protein
MQETPADLDEDLYRTWSVPALLTGGIGAVSWVALFSGTLIFVPVLALILALVTWWQIAARPEYWLGGRVAWFGVAVAMLSLGVFAGREWSQRSWYFEGARQTAEQWLRYQKEGQPLLAYDLLRKPPKRLLVSDALRELLADNKEEHEKHDKYAHLRIVDLLQQHGPTLAWKLQRISPHLDLEFQKYFYVLYQVEYQANQRTETVPVEFVVERALFPGDKETRWTIMSVSSDLVPGELPLEHTHEH